MQLTEAVSTALTTYTSAYITAKANTPSGHIPTPTLNLDPDAARNLATAVSRTDKLTMTGIDTLLEAEMEAYENLLYKADRDHLLESLTAFMLAHPEIRIVTRLEEGTELVWSEAEVFECINYYKSLDKQAMIIRESILGNLGDKITKPSRKGKFLAEAYTAKYTTPTKVAMDTAANLYMSLEVTDPINIEMSKPLDSLEGIAGLVTEDFVSVEDDVNHILAYLQEMDENQLTTLREEDEDLSDFDANFRKELNKTSRDLKSSGKATSGPIATKAKYLAGKAIKAVNKAISLKNDDVSKTLTLKYRVLRVAIAVLSAVGVYYMPIGIIAKLITSIVATIALDGYDTARTNKAISVLESQANYLEEKISLTDDLKDKRAMTVAYKNIQTRISTLRKKADIKEETKAKAGRAAVNTVKGAASKVANRRSSSSY